MRAALAAVATIALSAALAACGGQSTATVTQPATGAPLGRAIGTDAPVTGDAGGHGARDAARRFLESYLAVSYGHRRSDELPNASRRLREHLRAQAPRVPPGVRNRNPRVVALRLETAGGGRVRAAATVNDGDVAPYPLFATLAHTAEGRWVAVSVGG